MEDSLKKDIQKLEKDVGNILSVLESMNTRLDRINTGLYGDEDNGIPGFIKRITSLEKEIEDIKKINNDQDIAIKAKGGLMDKLIKIAGGVAFAYLILKDVIGIDSIFELFLRK
jgi:hypothetical protein